MASAVFRKGTAMRVGFLAFLMATLFAIWVMVWAHPSGKLESARLGVDSCAHCGMIISDPKFVISILDEDEQGHTVTRHFDDPGCFQEFAKKHEKSHWIGVAHDYRTGQEIPMDQAKFIRINEPTPMGSGVGTIHE